MLNKICKLKGGQILGIFLRLRIPTVSFIARKRRLAYDINSVIAAVAIGVSTGQ